MKPSRWLLALTFALLGLLWLEHIAVLTIPYRESPTQFRESKYIGYWVLFLLPCVCATGAVIFARAHRRALRCVMVLLLLSVFWIGKPALSALQPVSELPYVYDAADESVPLWQISYPEYVWGLPLYGVLIGFPWFAVALVLFFAVWCRVRGVT